MSAGDPRVDAASLRETVLQALPDAGLEVAPCTDQPTLYVPREQLLTVCTMLRDDPTLRYTFLAEVTAVDYLPREPRFEIVYHLACIGRPGDPAPARLRLKVRVPGDDPQAPTLSALWPVADWPEREVYDLFGIVFGGHPDLRRILTPDDWEGHPLRKDYPGQGRVAGRTTEPRQVTEEEFVANIARARQHGGRTEGS